MANNQNGAAKDPYVESITAQIKVINDAIESRNKKDFDKIAELEAHKAHYLKHKKEAAKNS